MSISKSKRIAGAVYGFAIGDAMGATTEFMSNEEIKFSLGKVTEIQGGGWLHLPKGAVTDDTQMMMCVMDALMEHPKNVGAFKKSCANNFIKWYESLPADVGAQCQRGILHLQYGVPLPVEDYALGNGSLMRALPCALIGNGPFNVHQGMLTHNNQKCHEKILEYSDLIQECLNGKYQMEPKGSLLEPSGYIVNTLNNAIYWSRENSFEDAIIGAVNDGGDADTIAAITGGLAGAHWGIDSIPQKWIDSLDFSVKNYLNKFIKFANTYVQ